jgi:hypothetical protein
MTVCPAAVLLVLQALLNVEAAFAKAAPSPAHRTRVGTNHRSVIGCPRLRAGAG